MTHKLELAVKDALKQTHFEQSDDMLLQLHLLYESSPKKCHEIEEIVTDSGVAKPGQARALPRHQHIFSSSTDVKHVRQLD